MKIASLFSGGKDSVYSAWLAGKEHELVCLISMFSENKESYMFHTPSVEKTRKQAEVMGLPLIVGKTAGVKEEELKDLEEAILAAKEKYGVEGIVTGALHSEYQRSRIAGICEKLGLECINPLWHKDEFEYLEELIENNFKVIVVGVFAGGLDESWLGREIDAKFVADVRVLHEKFKIHPAGEGGEFETFVLNCPLFSRELVVVGREVNGEDNSWKMEVEVE